MLIAEQARLAVTEKFHSSVHAVSPSLMLCVDRSNGKHCLSYCVSIAECHCQARLGCNREVASTVDAVPHAMCRSQKRQALSLIPWLIAEQARLGMRPHLRAAGRGARGQTRRQEGRPQGAAGVQGAPSTVRVPCCAALRSCGPRLCAQMRVPIFFSRRNAQSATFAATNLVNIYDCMDD